MQNHRNLIIVTANVWQTSILMDSEFLSDVIYINHGIRYKLVTKSHNDITLAARNRKLDKVANGIRSTRSSSVGTVP